MRYNRITTGRFIERPNRFIAHVEICGALEVCHVKNTGRCKELLVPGARVILEVSDNPNRKTAFDLIAVYKGDMIVNIDSNAPNRLVQEWLPESGLFKDISLIRPETFFGKSRFDFYVKYGEREAFIEVKGVTLEENSILRFPDAPTERGVKHLSELCQAVKSGYDAYVIFVIQMEKALAFEGNEKMHPEFCAAMRAAAASGVKIKAFKCAVSEDEISITDEVCVNL